MTDLTAALARWKKRLVDGNDKPRPFNEELHALIEVAEAALAHRDANRIGPLNADLTHLGAAMEKE